MQKATYISRDELMKSVMSFGRRRSSISSRPSGKDITEKREASVQKTSRRRLHQALKGPTTNSKSNSGHRSGNSLQSKDQAQEGKTAQERLNYYVLSVPVKTNANSECNFGLHEKRDPFTDEHMIGAVHNCKQYGLDLVLYLYNEDLESRI